MSTEETNGFSAPNEDANVAGGAANQSAPPRPGAPDNQTPPRAA